MPRTTKTENTTFIDYRAEVLAQLNANCRQWQAAVGNAAVGYIVKKMQSGYSDSHPTYNIHGEVIGEHMSIRDTGDLQRDVNYEALPDGKGINVGNSLEYAKFVHEGTCKLHGRPYIRDALTEHRSGLERIAAQVLRKGF